jgi:hypothetical protein
LNAVYAKVPATCGICFCEIISDKSMPMPDTFASVRAPTRTVVITVRNIPEGAPAFGGSEGFSPAASATLESRTESTLPVSMPKRTVLPSPICASTQGVPSQSSNGTSAANFVCTEANGGVNPAIAQANAARAKVLKAPQGKGISVLRLIGSCSPRVGLGSNKSVLSYRKRSNL